MSANKKNSVKNNNLDVKYKFVFISKKLSSLYKEKLPDKESKILDVLIATKLSQNTTDKTSYKAYLNLKKTFKQWDSIAESPLKKIESAIKMCGLANTKARDIKAIISHLKEKYGKADLEFMREYDNAKIYSELTAFKGIGVKTASCVIAFALGRPVFPVDTHIHRILNRLGLINSKTAEETFKKAESIIPDKIKIELHRNLIKFGREICKAVKPACGDCILFEECDFENKYNFRKKSAYKKTNNFLILDVV